MSEFRSYTPSDLAKIYDQQALTYEQFSSTQDRFAWSYIEAPAYERLLLPYLLRPNNRILVIGCGSGTEIDLLKKFTDQKHITGIDISQEQLKIAKTKNPDVNFIQASADDFNVQPGNFDLVITNTMLHHLDNDQFASMLYRGYDALTPGGRYFAVEVDPYHSLIGRDPAMANQWIDVQAPWQTKVPFFTRPYRDLFDILDRQGFEYEAGGELTVDPQGIEHAEYDRYANRNSRFAILMRKAPILTRILRVNNVLAPELALTPEQKIQVKLADLYFEAWKKQSLQLISHIFTTNAIYDEKPGKEKPLLGIEEIIKYWKHNPLSQKNIHLEHDLSGFSDPHSIWTPFKASFDVRNEHVSLEGVVQFTTNLVMKKITRLSEYFITTKRPLTA